MLDDIIRRGVSWAETSPPNEVVCYLEGARIFCRDGFSFTATAGKEFCSSPQKDTGPYNELEISFPSARPEPWEVWKCFSDETEKPPAKRIFGFVPVKMVECLIESHGGEVEPPEPVPVENLPGIHKVKAKELSPTLRAMQEHDKNNPTALVLETRFVVYSPLTDKTFLIANSGDAETALHLARAIQARTKKSVVLRFPVQRDANTEIITSFTVTLMSNKDWKKSEQGKINYKKWPWNEGIAP